MKLTEIDLSSPGEVEDALHILQTILGKKPAVDVVLAPATFDAATTPAFPGTPDTRTVADVDAQIKAENAPADPAAVFGAAAPAVPLAPMMPSTAAATPVTVAPPAPAMPAPAIPTNGPALPAAPAPSVELDAAGVAWSADLHAANKSKCKDGTWKARRGLAGDAAPAVPLAPTTPTPTVPSVTVPASVPPPTAPTLPAAVPTVPPTADAGPTTFAQLMPRVTAAITANILPPAELRVACDSVGCSSVVQLQEAPEFVPLVWAWLRERYPELQ